MEHRARRASGGCAGFTLPELLAVVTILALAVAVAIPLVSEQVRAARSRTAAQRYASSLREARMVAVTKRLDVSVDIQLAVPDGSGGVSGNSYEYTDAMGHVRRVELPPDARIVSADSPIVFRPNGSVGALARTEIESGPPGDPVERWTVRTNVIGVTTTTHTRIAP